MRFLALALVLSSSVSQAAVGDWAEFRGWGIRGFMEMREEITSPKVITARVTVGQDSQVVKQASDGATCLDFKKFISNCAQNEGVLETIRVPAGTFKTCKVVEFSHSRTVWMGAVPLGIVKVASKDPGNYSLVRFASIDPDCEKSAKP